jgi:hypothetical protein
MTSIQAALNLLRNIKPTKAEICKAKILLAAHGEWVTSKQIREKANFKDWPYLGLMHLAKEGLIEERRFMHLVECGAKCYRRHYRTTAKGTKHLTQLMK